MPGDGRIAERFDVVVVGARCTGAPLAALMARAGVKVALVEQAKLPGDTLSSHTIQADALAFLDRLGILPHVRATEARFFSRIDARFEDFSLEADWPQRSRDVGGGANIRRHMLDPILMDAAAEAGVETRMGTRVVGLVRDGARVAGVRISHNGSERDLNATLVVGADGRSSTVARLSGARAYHVTDNQRAYYWSFFEGANHSAAPTFVIHRWGSRFILGAPSDSDLYFVGVSPELDVVDEFRRDIEPGFMQQALACEPVASALAGARRATKIFGIVRFKGYFREATGPGWVLAGDAGHFKDPAEGRGMGDAFLQVDALVPEIVAGLAERPLELDRRLARWGRWRDREFIDDYWLAADFLGRAGPVPVALPEMARLLEAKGTSDRFLGLLNHRSRPPDVFTPGLVLGATGRLLARRRGERRAILRETGALAAAEVRHRWLQRRPVFA